MTEQTVLETDAARVILVTGLSGAGRTTCLKTLEDQGFEAVDNLPLSLLSALLSGASDEFQRIAVGIDIRTRDFAAGKLADHIETLRQSVSGSVEVLFLDCDDETLNRRFTETRRRHPLAQDRPVADGIRLERRAMEPVRAMADHVIDSSDMTIAGFGTELAGTLGLDGAGKMTVAVQSFSFRKGLPRGADMVMDVRFLRNPHYDQDLRSLDGRDDRIASYISLDPGFDEFVDRLDRLIEMLLPRYAEEGKSYFTIAFGCTGGKHRSVFLARRMAELVEGLGYPVALRHRELEAAPVVPDETG